MRKSLGRLILLVMIVLLSGSHPVAGENKKNISKAESKDSLSIQWYRYDKGLEKAKSEKKFIMLFFRTKFCKWCNLVEKTTFVDREVVRRLGNDFVSIRMDIDSGDKSMQVGGRKASDRDVAGMFGVFSYPYFVFLDKDQENLGVLPGYIETANFLLLLEYVGDKHYKKQKFGEFLKEKKGKTKEK